MESPKAREERTLLAGCYGLRQFTASLGLLLRWTVCRALRHRSHSLLHRSLNNKDGYETGKEKVRPKTSNPYFCYYALLSSSNLFYWPIWQDTVLCAFSPHLELSEIGTGQRKPWRRGRGNPCWKSSHSASLLRKWAASLGIPFPRIFLKVPQR